MRTVWRRTWWMVVAGVTAALAAAPGAGTAQTLATASAGGVWQPDQLCLAHWQGTDYWFAARILSREPDGRYRVQFFEGGEDTLSSEQIRPERLAVGDSVHAIWQRERGTSWYRGVVSERRGMVFVVDYGNGETETTSLEWMRVPAAVVSPEGDGAAGP